MKIVQFKDGKFGVRKVAYDGVLWIEHQYINGSDLRWSATLYGGSKFDTIEEAREIIRISLIPIRISLIPDEGVVVENPSPSWLSRIFNRKGDLS